MKKFLTLLLSITLLFSLAACSRGDMTTSNNAGTPEQTAGTKSDSASSENNLLLPESSEPSSEAQKILIAYFSHTGTTEGIADQIHKLVGGDLVKIETVTPYSDNYQELRGVAEQEMKDNARPELSTHIDNMDEYDVIFVGYPIWWHTAPMAIYTFIESYDLSGKTVVPFCTSSSSDIEESMPAIKELCPNSTILDGLTVHQEDASSAQDDVSKWVQGIDLNNE